MSRTSRILDVIFWSGSIAILSCALLGCGSFKDISDAVSEPATDGTGTVLSDAIDAVPAIVANPFDLADWSKIVALVLAGGAAALGYKKVKSSLGK